MASIFDGILSGVAGGLGSVATSLINANTARLNTDKTNAANLQLSQYAYGQELANWNRQNEYNSPASQMQRFKDAGLNPNLIYGQGTPGNATQLPKYQAPNMRYNYAPKVDPSAVLQNFMDMRVKSAQVDNLQAQNDAITKSNQLKDLQIKGFQGMTGALPDSYDENGNPVVSVTYTPGYYDALGNRSRSEASLAHTQADLAKTNFDQRVKELTLKNQLSQKALDYFLSNIVIKAIGGIGGAASKFF